MIGFTPIEIDQMSMWQFMAAVDGYAKAHDPDAAKELTVDEEEALWEFIQDTKH